MTTSPIPTQVEVESVDSDYRLQELLQNFHAQPQNSEEEFKAEKEVFAHIDSIITARVAAARQEGFLAGGQHQHVIEAASQAAPAKAEGWISCAERLPEVGRLVMVYSPPTQYDHPGDVNITFDCIDPNDDDHASWLSHNEHHEHFCCVAKPEGSIGPSEKAPYTHWHAIPAAPSTLPEKNT